MKVILSERVQRKLAILDSGEREKIKVWLGYLPDWEHDPFVRSQSVALEVQGQSVYMFRTSTDIRIFYTVDVSNKTILVVDVATTDTILSFGGVAAGVS